MASAQHYCLRWNNYQSNLTSVFDQLLQTESFVDVTLAVAGRSLKAHKVILSACSPYFQHMLRDNPCQHPIVILNDVSYADMHAVVQFMYKGEISVAEQQLPSLLKVAEALKIRGLADVPEGGLGRASPESAPSPPAAEASYSPRGMVTPELIESCVDVAALSPASGTASPLVSRPPETADIRPAIAEMIKDEERAKMLENAASWNASPEVTFQHQLQAAWQKSWNQKQSLMQNLRFRERGSIKSWRPETMADAIMSVLREGHTLSQAARKYDIPYPTFVLYANRVHNLLGPSVEGPGCTINEMRPKGRGRPQRILLGCWPDDTVKNVIRAVVFRDTSGLKEQQMEEANAAAAAAAAAGIARNNESPNRGPPMPQMPPAQQNGRPQFPVTSAAMARPAMETGPRGPPGPPRLPGPPRPPGPQAQHGIYRPPPPVAPPRGQMPNLLGFPDIHMMMGMFPPGMMSSTGAVPTINLPPLVDMNQSVAPADRSPPGRPVPPLSSIGGSSDSSPDRASAKPPTETPHVRMETDEDKPTEPPSQHQAQQQKPQTQPPQGEEALHRQPPPPPPMSQSQSQTRPMSQAQSQMSPMSQAQSQTRPISQAQSSPPPMSLAQSQMSQAQSQMPPMSQTRPMSQAQPPMSLAQLQMSQAQSQMPPMSQTRPMSQAQPPMSLAQSQMPPMSQAQPPMSLAQSQMPPMSQAQPPMSLTQSLMSPMSQAQSQMQSSQAQLARMMPQLPPLQPDSPPGGAGGGGEQRPLWQQPRTSERAPLPVTSAGGADGGGEQRPLWQQPPAAERAPLPVTSPAIQATP